MTLTTSTSVDNLAFIPIDELRSFIEDAINTVKIHPNTEWIFKNVIFENLVGDYKIIPEYRMLRAAIVIFTETIFSCYAHSKMLEELFHTKEVYNALRFGDHLPYINALQILNTDSLLKEKSHILIKNIVDFQIENAELMEIFNPKIDFPNHNQSLPIQIRDKFVDLLLKIISEESCKYYSSKIYPNGFSVEEIVSPWRKREVAQCRYVFIFIFRNEYKKLSQTEIGKPVGGKDHSTVSHAIAMHNELFIHDENYKSFYISVISKIKLITQKIA